MTTKNIIQITAGIVAVVFVGMSSSINDSYGWHDFLQPTWTSASHTFECTASLDDINEDAYVDPCDDFETASDIWDIVSNSNWDLDESGSGEIPIGSANLGSGSPVTIAQTTTNTNFWGDIISASMDFNNNNAVSFTDVDQTTTYAFDYVSVSVHEIGHLLHLAHSSETDSPMYASLSAGEKSRILTDHDEDAIAGMY